MGEAAATTATALTEIRSAVDLLHGRVSVMDTTQQSLVAQLNLIAVAVQEGAKANADAVRHLASLDQRVNNTSHALKMIQYPSPEEDDPDPVDSMVAGKGALHTTAATWTGNAPGASSAAHKLSSLHAGMEGNMTQGGGGLGGADGSVLGGVGGGGLGGTGSSVLGGVGGSGLGGVGGLARIQQGVTMAPSKPSPMQSLEAMGEAKATMEARLTAITASLNESRRLLASCGRPLDVKKQEEQAATRQLFSATTMSLSAPDQARKQPEIKHLPPLLISLHQVVGTGAPKVAAVVASPMPSRCSTKSPGHYINNGHAELMFAPAVKLSSPSSSLMAVIPGLHNRVVDVLPPETLVVGAAHSVCEEMLAISKDKMDMDSAIRQTYDENCEDMVTHIGCVSLFCELGLASAEDLCAERISKDMVLDEELGATVLTHVGDCSLFIEHDMDTCPEFQASCFANNPCNHGVSLTKLLQSTGCTQDLKSIGSVSVYGFTPSILSQIIRERTTKGCARHILLEYTHAPPAQIVLIRQDIFSFHVEQLSASSLHIDWDPGGFTIASLPLNRTPFAEHNIVYSKNNLLMNFKGCGDNNTIVLAAEHYFQWVDLGIVMTFLMVAVASNNELPDMLSLLEGATTANAFESQLQYKQWDPGNLEAQYKQWDPGNLEALPWPDGYSVLNKNKWKFTLEDLYSFQSSNQFIDNLQQVGRKVESCQGVIHVTTRFLYMNWSSTVLQPERSIAWGQAMFFGGGNVMPIHYNILGSADMGCGLTAMGLTCGVVTIRTKLRLRCQGIEEV